MMPTTLSEDRMAVSHRMQRALAQAGYQQVEAARVADVPRGVIHKAVQRGSVPRDKDTRDRVAKALGVEPSWLWKVGADAAQANGTAEPTAHDPAAPEQPILQAQHIQAAAPALRTDPQGYALIVPHGDFMPFVKRNDCLWVTPSYAVEPGDLALIRTADAEEMVAYVSELNATGYQLMLPQGGRKRLERNQVEEVHKVSGVLS